MAESAGCFTHGGEKEQRTKGHALSTQIPEQTGIVPSCPGGHPAGLPRGADDRNKSGSPAAKYLWNLSLRVRCPYDLLYLGISVVHDAHAATRKCQAVQVGEKKY